LTWKGERQDDSADEDVRVYDEAIHSAHQSFKMSARISSVIPLAAA
jgi:hypothetical protein